MTTTSNIKPTLGRVVIYESRNGDKILSPAIVIRTQDTTDLEVMDKWKVAEDTLSGTGRPVDLVPQLSTKDHVDLVVFGLGGDYREYNVPFSDVGGARTWNWPVRA